jgi:hypothetical protein
MTKRDRYVKSLEEQRERLEAEAYDLQKTTDARELGPVITAYGVILEFLDHKIASLGKS